MVPVAGVVLVIALGGCEWVFAPSGSPLDGGGGGDIDGEVDAAPPDADVACPVGTMPAMAEVFAIAEATLSPDTPDQNLGDTHVVNAGVDLGSRGLFAFDVGPIAGETPESIRLTLPYSFRSSDCAPDCGSCAGVDRGGQAMVHVASSAWFEYQVTWMSRSAGDPWIQPGAGDPGTDRGFNATPAAHVHMEPTVFELGAAARTEAWQWLLPAAPASYLSFIVTGLGSSDTGTVMVISSREGVLAACDPDNKVARLEIGLCVAPK